MMLQAKNQELPGSHPSEYDAEDFYGAPIHDPDSDPDNPSHPCNTRRKDWISDSFLCSLRRCLLPLRATQANAVKHLEPRGFEIREPDHNSSYVTWLATHPQRRVIVKPASYIARQWGEKHNTKPPLNSVPTLHVAGFMIQPLVDTHGITGSHVSDADQLGFTYYGRDGDSDRNLGFWHGRLVCFDW